MKLEEINQNTCSLKIQVMRLNYVSEQLEKCRNCNGEYYNLCEKYKPLSRTQIPFTKGSLAYINYTKIKEGVK